MTGRSAALPSALDLDLPALLGTQGAVVFLDYDGTLTPIVPRPEDAILAPEMRTVLSQLAERCPVAVLSGRDLADVRSRIGLSGLAYAGSHGFEFVTPEGFAWQHPKGLRAVPLLDELEVALSERLSGIAGAQVERKRFSLSAHYRRVATGDLPAFEQVVREVVAAHPGLHHATGKMVHDFRPNADWNKGKALRAMRVHLLRGRGAAAVTVFIGDDRTDEDAFAALGEDDVGIMVGTPPAYQTGARYALRDCVETRRFLEQLTAALPPPRVAP